MSVEVEPKFTQASQLSTALNWYSSNRDYDQSKLWFEAYLLKRNMALPKYSMCVGNIGFLCRMIDRGFPSTPSVDAKIADKYNEWLAYTPTRKVVEKDAPVVQKWRPKFSDILIDEMTNFSLAVDANFWAEDKTISTFQKYHTSPRLTAADAKILDQMINEQIVELAGVAKLEKEYRDCYPSAAHIKRLLAWLNAIVETRKAFTSANLKPKKDVPPIKQVAAMQYQKEVFGIKGMHPQQVIGCTAVLLYNEKIRRIMYYEAKGDFFANGTRFMEIQSHFCRTLRKPEQQVKDLMQLTKPQARAYINKMPGVNGIVQDRMNENVVILRTWRAT